MLMPFGIPNEVAPGKLVMPLEKIAGAHITLLKADGSGHPSPRSARRAERGAAMTPEGGR